jgi:CRISPR-associated protein Cas1
MEVDGPSVVPDLLPARILNEHVYCPRLAYLEWVGRQFTHKRRHRRGFRGAPPRRPRAGRAAGARWPRGGTGEHGLIAKIDLLEPRDRSVVPVEYKRGRPWSAEQPLRDPELVQVCGQVLLLREAGYVVEHAEAWFAETRSRHRVEIDTDLIARTLTAIAEARENAQRSDAPPPLVDSPKCPRCSLVGICLPDEVNLLRGRSNGPARRLRAGDSPAQPLYATTPGSRVTKRGGRVVMMEGGEQVASTRLIDVSHISVFGNVDVGSALLRECFDAGRPVLWFSAGGWFSGVATGMPPQNVDVRVRQHRAAVSEAGGFASAFVAGKIRNSRTLVRRHGGAAAASTVRQLAELANAAETERRSASLLGIERTAARLYFGRFATLLANPSFTFDFAGRNRRPPRDRVNALLSFVYALLVKDVTVALLAAGLDPYLGFYHRPRFGRPALSLDLAEELRPLIGDSVVLTAINNGEVGAADFIERAGGVALTAQGRKKVIATYERRMTTELRHPLFGYRVAYRRALELQARLLAAVLVGDIDEYRPLTTR